MKNAVIQYAVIRFMPYPEIGEFVNIGVIAIDPKRRQFRYKLAQNHSKRATDFFHNLDRQFYISTVKQIQIELEARFRATLYSEADAIEVFEDLTKSKSNLFQFEQTGVLKAVNLDKATDQLYKDFIGHEFAKTKTYEELLRVRVRTELNTLKLERPFEPKDIRGPGGIHARFEFVQGQDKAERIIKPFGFDGNDANKLDTHLAHEVRKLKIAKKVGFLDKNDILIPIDIVIKTEGIAEAWKFMKPELENFGDLLPASETEKIRDFATQ